MLTLRLQRIGRRNHAAFRLVATESSTGPKSAKHVEMLGHYDPHKNSATLNSERIVYWLKNGAQASDTVHNLLVTYKVLEGPKRARRMKKVEGKAESEDTVGAPKQSAGTSGEVVANEV